MRIKEDREWGQKRTALRGEPSWQYFTIWTAEEVVQCFNKGEIPAEARIESAEVVWYGWPKDENGPAEEWTLVKYG